MLICPVLTVWSRVPGLDRDGILTLEPWEEGHLWGPMDSFALVRGCEGGKQFLLSLEFSVGSLYPRQSHSGVVEVH